jgi:hypothetical protein
LANLILEVGHEIQLDASSLSTMSRWQAPIPIKFQQQERTTFGVEGKEACPRHRDDIKVTVSLQGSVFPTIHQYEETSKNSDKEIRLKILTLGT